MRRSSSWTVALSFLVCLAPGVLTPVRPRAQQAVQGQAAGGSGAPQRSAQPPGPPTRADILHGGYGEYRANNDLLSYDLSVRVDPGKKWISGKNTIKFRMLKDDTRIQLDLFANLNVDRIALGGSDLKYEREGNVVWVDFPAALRKGRVYAVDFSYSGSPARTGRFGGITFGNDPAGRPWINTACQHTGSSVWWPSKDQYRDEVENMRLSVAIPNDLVDVSNGRFLGKTDLGDGYTRWDWMIDYPINDYCVSLNIGKYVHFSDSVNGQTLDFYCLPEDLEKAKAQFAQAKSMMQAYEKYVGEYAFKKDGYKLIQAPYSGMEHQTAVTYGNGFRNGYGGGSRDWTGVGISTKFDFIIVHESAHEWFGNAVTAADVSDEWIHEGWGTYLEGIYVEYMWGKDDAIKYLNGYKSKVRNQTPIVAPRGVNRVPPQDMYFKGALFINTLRSIVDNDTRWWALVHDFYNHFKYQDIMTEDVVKFFNDKTKKNLTPVFAQYLQHTEIPTLELEFRDAAPGLKPGGPTELAYRWKADEKDFAMPIKVGRPGAWQTIEPTTDWKTMKAPLPKDAFEVATDLYFVNVTKK